MDSELKNWQRVKAELLENARVQRKGFRALDAEFYARINAEPGEAIRNSRLVADTGAAAEMEDMEQ